MSSRPRRLLILPSKKKKHALIKTRIYNYCISYALPDYRDSGRSRPMENKRTGGGECRAGTGSPRKTFALARWMQHEITRRWWSILAMGAQSAAIDCIFGRDPQVWVPHRPPPLATVLAEADIAPEPSRVV